MPNLISLERVRAALRLPTLLVAYLSREAGARLRSFRLGRLTADFTEPDTDSTTRILIRVSARNVFAREALAYRQAGLPVPPDVLRDKERWEQEYGRIE